MKDKKKTKKKREKNVRQSWRGDTYLETRS